MTTTFITGANKSLGYETARRLIEVGHSVVVGARDPERGRAAADALGARFVQIDVTDDASVAAAAADIEAREGGIDVLINNAGVFGTHSSADRITAADADAVFEVNVVGIVRVTHAFLPLLRRSSNPVIVNVSSGMGSFAATHDSERVEGRAIAPLYTASKAAVTMLTTQYAKSWPDVKVNAADPGYTATDFNGHSGPQTVTEGTDAIVELATIGADGPSGTLRDRHGDLAW
ncbi:SDR family NAD(P)-dependent oxidoreductase [Streptomyces sp. WI04-05B]|uniref:SDR family NAD(P)-dependent oxidoreductase n=1 Tax=Streptomyces TaxID=1883 RepID=UPI0029B44A34|nr:MULTISPECIES: SDR family NAD(P)-dependent oxidoreductase [unclassified Streptomyces]MDX2546436.1 SDR family NAD(P)-dependent oxidoreductase [Streptomyces sp. WI04-05B]MDX2586203.1 SDR family NAD(P)-dependent oxidoreductase [Streptomyces sp. WI04-05A]MDX3748854.1 SDR family NAD(P)-dependent oxidoreductase [Streptomyces sp. AK08-02]